MFGFFPKFEESNIEIENSQQTPNRRNIKKSSAGHKTTKFSKTNDKEKCLMQPDTQ